ncbi:MAG: N-acetylmuramic acid 6-phosphate etherase, partial [Thermomicrobium sp.]|nr:N-acetylmuramic acid 6-phosphate etherase [Thermomicrobium sp.]
MLRLPEELRHLETEATDPRFRELDRLSSQELVDLMLAEEARVVPALRRERDRLAQLVDVAAERLERGGRLVYVGAGTSGRLAVLDALECRPTFGLEADRVVALLAGGPPALHDPLEDAEDDESAGARDVAALGVDPDDVVLGISASGRTPYVLGALARAREQGAFVAALVCQRPSPLEPLADLVVAPLVGPEVVAGSTRMKAGTAQKIALTTLSTAVMVRLGRTYGNLMVDVRPANRKLWSRAVRIVAEVTGLSPEEAARLLGEAGGEAKTAIVMALT